LCPPPRRRLSSQVRPLRTWLIKARVSFTIRPATEGLFDSAVTRNTGSVPLSLTRTQESSELTRKPYVESVVEFFPTIFSSPSESSFGSDRDLLFDMDRLFLSM